VGFARGAEAHTVPVAVEVSPRFGGALIRPPPAAGRPQGGSRAAPSSTGLRPPMSKAGTPYSTGFLVGPGLRGAARNF
jgi:hypothetical protein